MDSFQIQARDLARKIADLQQAGDEIKEAIAKDKAHINELLSLATRFRRSQSAREVLGGVEFRDCPKCGKELPQRLDENCSVCGQLHDELPTGAIEENAAEQDLESRVGDLKDLIARYEAEGRRVERYIRE